jgi:hypothetical protein
MIRLVHYTSLANLKTIVESGRIMDQLGRAYTKTAVREGEGDLRRKCCYPTNTYRGIQAKYDADAKLRSVKMKDRCTEGCGVFFRVLKPGDTMKPPRKNQVALLFDEMLLLANTKWHVNFCENNGLFIDDHVPWFGDDTVTDCPNSSFSLNDVLATKYDANDAEIIIYGSVDLKYLVTALDHKMSPINIPIAKTGRSRLRPGTQSLDILRLRPGTQSLDILRLRPGTQSLSRSTKSSRRGTRRRTM